MYKYTICFIRKGDNILLLNRNKKPTMGMWNGVGGKIEDNETPYEGVIRETFEETGIELQSVTYKGNVIFKEKDEPRGSEGMYVFLADLPGGEHMDTPLSTDEGILEWKSIDWILDGDNRGVVSNLQRYLPRVLKEENNLEHTFTYDNRNIIDYTTTLLTEDDTKKRNEKYLVSQ
ncbi:MULTISPECIES: NUDIX hydrolase [Bacillus cereus group]|uniref:DNA mismatch repair protein MutT n=1 Tax=Bacillus cereus TaxID=1396 RepID=A0A2B1DPA0_BACCE|nr:8-oxo-dGTP diphosphatase [Bacillus cereus]PDY83016.1 DNA mismatch repair protein MutT [Bacillus cereus]PFA12791.1 DNA mismatch repair protein MutT [Bacillus cereus]PFM39821.1 DNA mismatch repair protein MutT [Bacillus cereus]PGL57683.1 DNA mismatch repair protein MutT [Bacillus cereus]PGQ04764.1 DNA mismatch repair protein MutT [Bacillus cereus]